MTNNTIAGAVDFPTNQPNKDVNLMTTAADSLHDDVRRDKFERPAPKPTENDGIDTPARNAAQIGINRQYIPSSTLQLDNVHKLPGKSPFRKLVAFFQFKHGPSLPRSNATVDLLATVFSFAAMHLIYLGNLDFTSQRTIILFSSPIFTILFLYLGSIYSKKTIQSLNRELTILLFSGVCAFAALGLFAFLTKTAADVSRVWITTSMALTLLSLAGIRVLGSMGLLATNKTAAKNVVICGLAPNIQTTMRSLYKTSDSRVRVAKIFELSTQDAQIQQKSISPENPANQILRFVEHQRQSGTAIDQVWIALPTNHSHCIEEISDVLANSSVDVCVVPDDYSERLLGGDVNRYGDSKTVNISEVSLSPGADQFKRLFDIIFATVALLVFCVPMAFIACLIRIESAGPVLFRQKRYGVDGKEIDVLKFRSMYLHSDSQVRQATRNDARVTRIGKILRSTSLDELPQLLNVLFGTMSLVGPRPHAVAHNEAWRKQIKGYMSRHKVKPGITGWAQVHGWRGETDTAFKMQQRVNYDLEYIRNWSPWLDIKILFLTSIVIFRAENAY